ncbi:MAG: hypothetical protein NTX59_06680 [Elusimicrobia bacterium]|nr:hypothetical protein [Elusimicrobiota bacterium]
MKFMLGNITWNSRQWSGISHDKSNFKWVGANPKHIASESWNFKTQKGKYQYGFIENNGKSFPSFEKGGVIFFISTNIPERKRFIVGLYGKAEECYKERAQSVANFRAPQQFAILLPQYLELDLKSHLPKNKEPGRYITYISPKEAKTIFGNILWMLRNNNLDKTIEYKKVLKLGREYFPGLKTTPAKHWQHSCFRNIPKSELKAFSRKEFSAFSFGEILRILKNNKRLKESCQEHEHLREKMAGYLTCNGFRIYQDKRVDLLAKKHGTKLIVEVKSCRPSTLESQLRLGVAQLMYYGYLYEGGSKVLKLCLAIQQPPNPDLTKFVKEYCGFDLAFLSGGTLVYEEAV